MAKRFTLVVAGGTFDRLHEGHKGFITDILSMSDKAVIGITSDAFISSIKKKGNIEPYDKRKKALNEYIISIHATDRVQLAPIDDLYIPHIWNNLPIEAIVVTNESKEGAERINIKREEEGKSALKIVVHAMLEAEDGSPISSTRIRNGEIDRSGNLNINPKWFSSDLVLPKIKRQYFKEPFGEIINLQDELARNTLVPAIVSVGDVTTKLLRDANVMPNLAVVDFLIERKKTYSDLSQLGFDGEEKRYEIVNPPGEITAALFQAVNSLCKTIDTQHAVIQVQGEEDLAVVPLVLRAPLGSVLFYGQPGVGTVKVEITEEKKVFMRSLMLHFLYKLR
jgi:pantetheine-phosphate adenylyltransferase